jgi:putative hydrolase of the HAD superfamily
MHFSLDVWNTIITPNPAYANARNALLADRLGIEIALAKRIHTAVKRMVDDEAEATGTGYFFDDVYHLLETQCATVLGVDQKDVNAKLKGIEREFQRLFLAHPPHIPQRTIEVHQEALAAGHTFSIASNTNFVSGRTIGAFLADSGMKFAFTIFSDLEGVAKPHPDFFEKVAIWFKFHLHKELTPQTGVHIGDNPICDNPGALMDRVIIANANELAPALERMI